MTPAAFLPHLDPRIAADSVEVANLALCHVRLSGDARFPWLLLVPRRAGAVEICDLDPADQTVLMTEIVKASAALRSVTRCDKLNVAALGNVVAQLHVHVVARFTTDPAWPGPIWGRGPASAYEAGSQAALIGQLAARLDG